MSTIEQLLNRELSALDRRRTVITDALTRLAAIDNISSNGQHRPTGRKKPEVAAEPVKRRRRRRRRATVAASHDRIPVSPPAKPQKIRRNVIGVSDAVLDYVRTRGPQGARIKEVERAVGRESGKLSTIMWRLKKLGHLKLNNGMYTTA